MADAWSLRRSAVEWQTAAVIALFAVAYVGLVSSAGSVPGALQVPLFAVLGAMFMSIQHEVLHGHPTRWTTANTVIGFVPLPLWLPYVRYKESHIVHHSIELTDPLEDPESFYVNPDRWLHSGPLWRMFLRVNRTLGGRMTFGAAYGIVTYLWAELRRSLRSASVARAWVVHVAGCAALCWWLFGRQGVSPAIYCFGFSFGGYSLTLLRSFAEHRAVATGTRSAVIRASTPMSLLYLNNNLHHTHHALPNVAWYRLPNVHAELGGDQIAADGAGLYQGGYWEIAKRYMFRPFCQPIHPLAERSTKETA
jgi:fatty acid desaturase